MSQALYDLPEGWEWVTLDDVTVDTANLSPEKSPETLWTYIDISAIDKDKFSVVEPKEILGKDAPSRAKKQIQQGDVLFATTRPNLKNIAIFELSVPNPVASTGFCVLRPAERIVGKFLFYFVTTDFVQRQIEPFISGASYPAVTDKNLKKVEIPLPPLAEQTRIVEKLDAVLSRIDTAIDELQQSLALVDAMFKSGLDKAFNPLGSPTNEAGLYDLPDGWEWKTLAELTNVLGDGLHGTPQYSDDGDFFFINGNNLNDGMVFLKDGTKRVSLIEYEKYKKSLNKNTVFVSINGTIGKVAFYNNEPLILSKSVCYFSLKEYVSKFYIKFLITSDYFLTYTKTQSTGTTIKNVSLKAMRCLPVPLPSLDQQQEIVDYLNALNDKTTQLKTELTAKIGMFNQLKASVLDGAFRGEL